MTLEEYVRGEVVEECQRGYLSRREALRRLTLLGVGAAAASALLAGCSGDEDSSGAGGDTSSTTTGPTSTTTAAAVGPPPLDTEPVTFPGPGGDVLGSWSAAADPRGAVLIIHENRGLTPHFVTLPGRLAASGYSALSVDLLSRRGGTDSFPEPAQAMTALTGISRRDLVADLRAGIDELGRRAPGHEVGVVGFCFGGGMVWTLLAAGEARLAAAVPFYGPMTETPADFSGAKAAVLAVYAENDQRVNGTRPAAQAALEAAGLTHEIKVAPGAEHAFFNETNPDRFDAAAAEDAYTALLDWFGRHLS